jgi:enoyl-CoA hydratase/carnithine racemase
MSTPRIHRARHDHVLVITLARADKKNAFDLQMLQELCDAYAELDRDPELRAGVVHAEGTAFTAGLDLANVAPALGGGGSLLPADAVDPWRTHGRAVSKPIVVAVHGLCLTLGIELLLAADVRVAADDARFAQVEIKRGIFPFGGGCARWVSTCGWGNAMRYLLTGDELDAREAQRIGLVQEVVPGGAAAALERALALAGTIAAQAPLGVQATLATARLATAAGEEAAARELLPTLRRLMGTDDAREGLLSFLERRAARFTGR